MDQMNGHNEAQIPFIPKPILSDESTYACVGSLGHNKNLCGRLQQLHRRNRAIRWQLV